jgi:hypothetical protein
LPPAGGSDEWPGADAFGSRYTFEAYIRDLGRFVRGTRRAKGWRRAVGVAAIWMFLGVMLLGIALAVVNLISNLLA